MNTIVTSKEEILEVCRTLVMEQGLSALSMRNVAGACGVSVGSIYNYFPSKANLISSSVEAVWRDIFHMSGSAFESAHFTEAVQWLFESAAKGCRKYPEFFTLHSVSFAAGEKTKGRETMEGYFTHMKCGLMKILDKDSSVRPDAFDGNLTKEAFVETIFTLFTSLLLQDKSDCDVLLEIAGRCIY